MEDSYLLISDVDGTLLGDDSALREFGDWHRRQSERIRLVYNSGRLFPSVKESVETTGLPQPDAIIGGVGTQVRDFATGAEIGGWPRKSHGWNPQTILDVVDQYSELELQPEEFLAEFKISCFAYDAPAELLAELKARLLAIGCPVELIYSSNRDLDFLPPGVDKGSAAAHLAKTWGFRPEHVYVSGDSGNDLAMFQAGFRGIVVSNAHAELKQLCCENVFQATLPYAAGVQQGLEYWIEQTKKACEAK